MSVRYFLETIEHKIYPCYGPGDVVCGVSVFLIIENDNKMLWPVNGAHYEISENIVLEDLQRYSYPIRIKNLIGASDMLVGVPDTIQSIDVINIWRENV